LTKIRNVRNSTKFKRSIKAISPVIATLLMIAIAVVASLVVYAWVGGYMGFQTDKAGKAIAIPSFALADNGNMIVYVQNVGQGSVQIGSVYVDDAQKADFTNDPTKAFSEGNTVELTIPGTYNKDTTYDIKVTTTDGTFMTATGKPGTGGSSGTTGASITLNPTSGVVGTPVTVSGSGFTASQTVSATFEGLALTISSATSDSSGAFSGVTFNVPSGSTGSKIVTFTAGTSASKNFIVTSPSLLNPTVPAPTLSQTSITVGDSITASVTVTGSGATPTGTATFQSSPDGATWTDIGTTVSLTAGAATSGAFTPSAAGTYSIRVIYSGDSVYNGKTSDPASLTVTTPSQHTISFAQTGSSSTVTVSYQINGGTTQTGNCPFDVALTAGQVISYTYPSTVDGSTGTRYVISSAASPASPQTMGTSDIAVSTTYKTQYQVTFDASSNVKSDSGSATIVTVAGSAKAASALPFTTGWLDSGSTLAYSYASPIASSGSAATTRYLWSSTSGLSQTLQTNTITVSGTGIVTATYTPQTFGISSSGSNGATSGTTVTVSSLNCPVGDVVVVLISSQGGNSISSVSGGGLTWTPRSSVDQNSHARIWEYYAVPTTSALTSVTVTFGTAATGTSGVNVVVFGISGANTASPFDGNARTASSTSNSAPTVAGVSTSNANDMIIGLEAHRSTTAATAGAIAGTTGTIIKTQTGGGAGTAAENRILTSTISSQSVAFSTINSNDWAMIVEAVKRAW
jgi:large repetitive protein